MPTQETMYQIGIELSKLFVSGLLGGLVAHYLSLRLFKAQQRLGTQREFKLKRLEALRDIKIYLHWLYRDIFYNWEKPANEKQSSEDYMFELMNKVNYWKTLFLNDQEMSKALEKLYLLIGENRDSYNIENKMPLGKAIEEIRAPVTKKIVEIEESIT